MEKLITGLNLKYLQLDTIYQNDGVVGVRLKIDRRKRNYTFSRGDWDVIVTYALYQGDKYELIDEIKKAICIQIDLLSGRNEHD